MSHNENESSSMLLWAIVYTLFIGVLGMFAGYDAGRRHERGREGRAWVAQRTQELLAERHQQQLDREHGQTRRD